MAGLPPGRQAEGGGITAGLGLTTPPQQRQATQASLPACLLLGGRGVINETGREATDSSGNRKKKNNLSPRGTQRLLCAGFLPEPFPCPYLHACTCHACLGCGICLWLTPACLYALSLCLYLHLLSRFLRLSPQTSWHFTCPSLYMNRQHKGAGRQEKKRKGISWTSFIPFTSVHTCTHTHLKRHAFFFLHLCLWPCPFCPCLPTKTRDLLLLPWQHGHCYHHCKLLSISSDLNTALLPAQSGSGDRRIPSI